MANHFFRNFKNKWEYNAVRLTAEHKESGLVIAFTDNKDGSYDGNVINPDAIPSSWDYRDLPKALRIVGEEMKKKLEE